MPNLTKAFRPSLQLDVRRKSFWEIGTTVNEVIKQLSFRFIHHSPRRCPFCLEFSLIISKRLVAFAIVHGLFY